MYSLKAIASRALQAWHDTRALCNLSKCLRENRINLVSTKGLVIVCSSHHSEERHQESWCGGVALGVKAGGSLEFKDPWYI